MEPSSEWIAFLQDQHRVTGAIEALRVARETLGLTPGMQAQIKELNALACVEPPSARQKHLKGDLGQAFDEWHDRQAWALAIWEDDKKENLAEAMLEMLFYATDPEGPRDMGEWGMRKVGQMIANIGRKL